MSSLRDMIISIAFDVNNQALADVDKKVNEFKDSIGASSVEIDDMTKSTVDLDGEMNKLGNTAGKASKSILDRFDSVGHNMQDVGRKMSLGITTPLAALGGGAVKTVATFDDSMSKVQAISGSTGDELESLRDKALELGSTTAHSASQVADAMSYQALAGWDANAILEATPGLLSLASAAQMDLATASDIVTDTMSQFSMEASRAGEAADVMAKIQASANTDVNQLGEALKYAGGEAASAGMDLQQTTAILGMFGDTGLKGSAAGTTFVSMLNDMKKNADDGAIAVGDMSVALYDAEGNMRDLGTIMTEVESATDGMSGAQRDAALSSVFGVEAMKGVNSILAQGTDRYRELEEAAYDSGGAAEEMAATMEDNIGGAFRSMWSAVEGFMIVLGDQLKPYVQDAADFIGRMASKFGELDEGMQKFIVIGGAIAAAIGPILLGVGWLISFIPKVVAGFKLLSGAMTISLGPIAWIVAAVIGIGAALVIAYQRVDWFRDAVNSVLSTVKGYFEIAFSFIASFVQSQLSKITAFWEENGAMIMEAINNAINFIVGIVQFGMELISIVFQAVWPTIQTIVITAWGVIQAVIETAINVILGVIQFFAQVFTGDWEGAFNTALQIANDIWNGIVKVFEAIDLFEIGKNIIQGLINGISSMASAVWNKVTDIASGIADKFSGALSIFSPSRLFKDFGIDTMLGYQIGFEDQAEDVNHTVENTADDIATAFRPDSKPTTTNTNSTNNSFSPQFQINVSGGDDAAHRVREEIERAFPVLMDWYERRMRAKMV